jgi:hypothetical protein
MPLIESHSSTQKTLAEVLTATTKVNLPERALAIRKSMTAQTAVCIDLELTSHRRSM